MKDLDDIEYAKLSHLKEGDYIGLDGGFDCQPALRVEILSDGRLFFQCKCGHHYLESQIGEDGDSLIGVYPY